MHKIAYSTGTSVIHRLYPITKLFWLLFVSIFLFILSNGYLVIGIGILIISLLMMIHPQILKIRGVRLVFTTGFMLFLLYVLFYKGGRTLLDPGPGLLQITTEGIETGLLICGRFYAIVFTSYLFILTTNPSRLAFALMKIGLPYRYGFMLITTLRLAPILEEEGRTIYQAQLVRGVQYDRAGPRKILLLVHQFLTPLLISSLRRADRLFFSMEGRGFGRYDDRTFRENSHPTKLDLFYSLGLFLFFVFVFIVEIG
ncbi:MAG: energy-coupling factor transporter transmembrane component T family protein [Brevefilum sp.]